MFFSWFVAKGLFIIILNCKDEKEEEKPQPPVHPVNRPISMGNSNSRSREQSTANILNNNGSGLVQNITNNIIIQNQNYNHNERNKNDIEQNYVSNGDEIQSNSLPQREEVEQQRWEDVNKKNENNMDVNNFYNKPNENENYTRNDASAPV